MFRITLPRTAETMSAGHEPIVFKGTTQPARILLVEDEEMVRETLRETLLTHDHRVDVACNGAEALRLFETSQYDLVITDYSMPGMSGLDVARAVTGRDPSVPVILLSGWTIQNEPERIKKTGIGFVLTKPCPMRKLLQTVQEALDSSVRFT